MSPNHRRSRRVSFLSLLAAGLGVCLLLAASQTAHAFPDELNPSAMSAAEEAAKLQTYMVAQKDAAFWKDYQVHAAPFFAKYCQDCHTKDDPMAEIKFDMIGDAAALKAHFVEIEKATKMLNYKLMPPKDKPQPTEEERTAMLQWLQTYIKGYIGSLPRNPGRVTYRRLNRTEYNNTIQDLLGVDIDTTPTFPEDNSGYGFDNNGDVLTVAPVLMEKYLAMADVVLSRTLFVSPESPPKVTRFDALQLDGTIPAYAPPAPEPAMDPAAAGRRGRGGRRAAPAREYPYNGELVIEYEFPADGTYIVRVRGYKVGGRAQVSVIVDGNVLGKTFGVNEDKGRASFASSEPLQVVAGKRRVAVALSNGLTKEAFEAAQVAAQAAQVEAEAAALREKLIAEAAAANSGAENKGGAENKVAEPLAPANGEAAPANPPPANAPPANVAPAAGNGDATPEAAGDGDPMPRAEGAPMPMPMAGAGRRGGRGGRGGGGGGGARGPQSVVLGVEFIEIEGPLEVTLDRMPASFRQVVAALPNGQVSKPQAAEQSIRKFASAAYRRPVTDEETQRLMTLWSAADQDGEDFSHSLHFALQAVLTSPNFLYRIEGEPAADDPAGIYQLNEHELANRLSYFLWSTMPDAELRHEAEQGTLRKNLQQQVRRMLQHPKSESLVKNFAGQWLQLRGLYGYSPNEKVFPDWDEALRGAIIRETELFFAEILRKDRSLIEFLDANYTFVNERLAKHYGIEGVTGDEFRKITFADDRRGGLLSQASFLTLTSYPDRTSPVRRGKWVLETLLATPPPDPPPGIPALAEQAKLHGTLRQQMEQHRENANCAACHALMDPIGFGLENFNAIGQWRDKDGADAIEPSGVLPTGEEFAGPQQLRAALKLRSAQLTRCVTEQMLTYALGRGLERTDQIYVDEIASATTAADSRLSAMILAIVQSDPFQKRSAKRGVE